MLAGNTPAFFFSPVAAVAATLTGLLGAFSTFRLHSMANKIALLSLAHPRQTPAGAPHEWLRTHDYARIEQLYDPAPAAVQVL